MELDDAKLRELSEKVDMEIEMPSNRQILKYIEAGDRVSYIGRDNKYRSGGFIVSIADDGSSVVIRGGNFRWTLKTAMIDTIYIVKKNVADW